MTARIMSQTWQVTETLQQDVSILLHHTKLRKDLSQILYQKMRRTSKFCLLWWERNLWTWMLTSAQSDADSSFLNIVCSSQDMNLKSTFSHSAKIMNFSAQDPSYYISPDVPGSVFNLACFVMAVIFVFGVTSNFSVVVIFCKSAIVSLHKNDPVFFRLHDKAISMQIRTPFNYILMNLVAADLMIASYGLPVDFLASYSHGWKHGKALCLTTGFILTTAGYRIKILRRKFSILV